MSSRGAGTAPLTYSLRRDHSDFVVFCFTKPEDAEALPNASVVSCCQRPGIENKRHSTSALFATKHGAERQVM
jgi:hypothetical protein